jgi:hypothetical protein
MTKQTWTLLVLVVVLGVLYVVRFTDLGSKPRIQINVTVRPFMPNAGPDDVLPMVFGLDKDWPLTALKVTPVAELTNAKPQAVWQLTAKNASEPTRGFLFGENLPGMQPVAGVPAGKLLPGVAYRLELQSGRSKGEADFIPQAALPSN